MILLFFLVVTYSLDHFRLLYRINGKKYIFNSIQFNLIQIKFLVIFETLVNQKKKYLSLFPSKSNFNSPCRKKNIIWKVNEKYQKKAKMQKQATLNSKL